MADFAVNSTFNSITTDNLRVAAVVAAHNAALKAIPTSQINENAPNLTLAAWYVKTFDEIYRGIAKTVEEVRQSGDDGNEGISS